MRKQLPKISKQDNKEIENMPLKPKKKSRLVEPQVRRTPIYLSKNAIAVLHIFTRYDHLEDAWMFDSDALQNQNWKLPEESAQQFIEQFERWWTPAFMMQLRDKIEETLIKHDKKYKTKFAKRSA